MMILNAYSSNSGGGRTGLISLLEAVPKGWQVKVFVDSRMDLDFDLPAEVQVERVAPTFRDRWRAERKIKDMAVPGTWVLRLGSVPPFFKLGVPVFVFFENRLLLNGQTLGGTPLKQKLRMMLERAAIRWRKGNVTSFVVQSQSVADELKVSFAVPSALVLPFHSTIAGANLSAPASFDFIYPASGDVHKNHRRLIEAWCLMAADNLRPSLCLTVDQAASPELYFWIEKMTAEFALKVVNRGALNPEAVMAQCRQVKALIYPSLCESFGRPLREAMDLGMPVLASELDYVRDLVDPVQSFDPNSPLSIARAVKRFLTIGEVRPQILTPVEFLKNLASLSERGSRL